MQNVAWLDDYALFMAVKDAHGGQAWNTWNADIRDRQPSALVTWRMKLTSAIEMWKFFQWKFFDQWNWLKSYANNKGVQIIEVNLKDYNLKKYEKRVVEQFEKVNGVDGLWLMPAYVPCDHLGKCIANKNGALAGKCSH